LQGSDAELNKQVEAGKKKYAGYELPGRTLGVIGLGAIGRQVANAANALGMKVIGFDPGLTVEGAWQLSADVQKAASVDELLTKVDFLTVHVPLIDATQNLINAERVKLMKKGAVILNFARDGIIDETSVLQSLDAGQLHAYVTDFPGNAIKGHAGVIALPHLGASTAEAEDNCAVMVADQVRDYLENGNVRNSVNFPEVVMPRAEGYRIAIVNSNVPNMLGQISTAMAGAGLNIIDMLNKSRGDLAYTLIDVDQQVPQDIVRAISAIDGVMAVRVME
jgi:D-3-phosphoglycerate dehydrogenase